jgi:hypothetical protein
VQLWVGCLKKLTRCLSFISYPMLPPQGASCRDMRAVDHRLPSNTLSPPASRPYADHDHDPRGPTYSPEYIPVSGWEDDPASEDFQHHPQSDSTFGTPQRQKRKAAGGNNTQRTHLPLRPTPEAYDFTPAPIHSEIRQEVCMMRSLSLAHWFPWRRNDNN